MIDAGASPWHADGMLELCALINACSSAANLPDARNNFERVMGKQPMTIGAWCEINAHAFR
jgi:hypothetical protein